MTTFSPDQSPEYWDEYSNLQHTKHSLIRHYLDGWFPKLGLGGARRVLYFDTHAGRGRYVSGQLGSPLVALTTLLNHSARDRLLDKCEVRFIFIERDEENLTSLKHELRQFEPLPKHVHVDTAGGDCFQLLEQVISSFEKESTLAPSFLFCDPYGFSIPGSLLRRLMEFPRVELFVNVIWRELDMAIRQGDKPGMAERLNSIFDGPAWQTSIASCDHDERAEQCVALFRNLTKTKWATYIRMLGENHATRYFLLHLTNHDAGRDLMKECVWKACPAGGYYVRKTDNPSQQFLIKPEPNLDPLETWVIQRLADRPQRWQSLLEDVRSEVWLPKHVNEVVRALRKLGRVVGEDYQRSFNPSNNPLLRLTEGAS
jgi:three-Cys-motif partner protein